MSTWYVVYTQPGAEMLARGELEKQGFEVYCPRYSRNARHARSVKRSILALFPRYLFVRIDLTSQRWRSINGSRGVSYIITMNERPCAVPDGVVEKIKEHENAEQFIEVPKLIPFKPGESLEISSGAFAKQVGSFLRLDKDNRIIVLLGMLGRNVEVRLQTEAVRAFG